MRGWRSKGEGDEIVSDSLGSLRRSNTQAMDFLFLFSRVENPFFFASWILLFLNDENRSFLRVKRL